MNQRLALIGLSLGYFMVLFDTTALTVALPDLARDLDAGVEGLAWITDGYTLTFAGCLLGAGVVADRYGSARVFRTGLVAFGAVSLLCAAAPSTATLVAARAVLGVAGALLLPASLAAITALFGDPAARSRAIASWASISGVALAAGPLLGGVLVSGLGWRGIFLVNAPVAAVSVLLVRKRLTESPRRSSRIAPGGQLAVLSAAGALTWALIRGGSAGLGSPDVLAALALVLVAASAAVRSERRAEHPAIPAGLLRAPLVASALLGGFIVGGAFTGELFLTTLQLQELRGYNPTLAGMAFLPLTVPMVVNPPIAARLVARVGAARPVFAGFVLIAAAGVTLAATPTSAPFGWVALGLVLLGCGLSLTLPSLTSATVMAAPPGSAGAAGGLFSVVRQTGATVGVAAATAITAAQTANAPRGHLLIAAAAGAVGLVWAATTAAAGARGRSARCAPEARPSQ